MLALSPHECRVLGVLIEKAQTTPAQYPITLNALVSGCNQLSNRFPVTGLGEETVLAALDGLRGKGLAREVALTGSRVAKFKHNTREALNIDTSQLVVTAELLLRGPQTVGEVRGRATRMHPLETIDIVQNVLQSLIERPEPLVRELAPAPGSRAKRYAQLLCPSLHPLDAAAPADDASTPVTPGPPPRAQGDLAARLEKIEGEVAALREALQSLAAKLGESDPLIH